MISWESLSRRWSVPFVVVGSAVGWSGARVHMFIGHKLLRTLLLLFSDIYADPYGLILAHAHEHRVHLSTRPMVVWPNRYPSFQRRDCASVPTYCTTTLFGIIPMCSPHQYVCWLVSFMRQSMVSTEENGEGHVLDSQGRRAIQ